MKIPGWFWIAFATVILVGGLVAGGIMLFVSWNHPSLTVADDYYQRAVGYDDVKAQEARNRALGWKPELRIDRIVDAGVQGTRILFRLTDGAGEPVDGAEVGVEAFHLARAGDRFVSDLKPAASGEYVAVLPLRKAGIWEFRFQVHRGDDTFTAILEREF